MALFIGLMSGTSADGMDGALVDISEKDCRLIDALCLPYPEHFRHLLKKAALAPSLDVSEFIALDRDIAQYSVQAIKNLLARNSIQPSQITAIGSHGHTLRHQPQPNGFSWQIGDPSWIAEHSGITCVADFRRRDIASGGQGAPLVPAFHAAFLPNPCMVLNLGGLANLSVLTANRVWGFDTGPANALLDEYCQLYLGQAHDHLGQLAASGKIDEGLLDTWLKEPYFFAPPPKSTGRELFCLANFPISTLSAADALCTLTELSARTVAIAAERFGLPNAALLLCGGGIHNEFLVQRIKLALPDAALGSTADYGLHPDWLEAMAFAWFAKRTLAKQSSNLPAATGAQGERVLGGIFYA